MITFYRNFFTRSLTLIAFMLIIGISCFAQIWQPEGLNMPGVWNGWANPPVANSPLGSEFQVTGGGVKKLTDGTTRWKTTFTGLSGGEFLFTSGGGNPWANKWCEVNVTMNALQNYVFQGGPNNNITCNPAKYYTMQWKDNGYSNTQAIFMETSAAPITISSTSQSPTIGNVTPSDPVVVTINLSASKSAEEIVYVRYTTDSYVTSTMLTATGSGTSYSATIPAQPDGTTIQYYAMTSTVSGITADHDMYSLHKSAGQSYASAALPPVNISFRVDMQNETVSGGGVFVAGSFNAWNTTSHQLSLISGTTYGITIPMAQGSTIEYKFINGTNYEGGLSGGCINGGGNRVYSVGNSAATIPSACFGNCAACVPKVATTFRVNMSGLTISGNGVHIAGDFGSNYAQWNPGAIALTHQGGGIYATTLMLAPGQVVPFKFINGNAWGVDEGVPGPCSSGGNRSYTVPGSASSTPLVCFGTCGTCITVTLQVDMSGETVSPNGVHVAGAFQGWNPGTTQLTNIGGNIYSRTVLVDPNQVSEYKFVNGNSWGNDESVADVCSPGTNGNRRFSMGTTSQTLPVVCFRQCLGCNDPMAWRGVSSNFADGNNWTSGWAPSSGSRNVIIGNTANNPSISSGSFSVGNLTFNGTGRISVGTGSTLNIKGNLNNAFNGFDGPGTVAFNGTSAQTLSGYTFVSDGASKILIDNAAGVSLSSGAKLETHGGLKLQSGVFDVSGGTLILGSDENGQGRLLKVESGASLNGNITYEKYLTGLTSTPNGGWYFVTPTTSGFTVGGYDQGGNNLHPASFIPSNPDPASIYYYSPSGGGFDEFGWSKFSSGSTTITSGQGIRVWARKVTSNSQFVYSGSHISSVPFSLSYCASGCSYPTNGASNGWNFLGNSFPCTIDWNAPTGWTKTGIDGNAVFVWNAASQNYSTYNGSMGLNGGSRYIAGGQAFFVNATSGSSALSMNEDVKADIYTSGLRMATEEISGLKISAISGNRRDEIFLDMTPGHETVTAPKLDNPGITLSFFNPRYSIAAPQMVMENGSILLKLLRASGAFSFELEKMGPEVAFHEFYLKDNVNGQLFPVNENLSTFSFFPTANDADRFSLIVVNSTTSAKGKIPSSFSVYPNPSNGKVVLRNANHLKGSYNVTDLSGKVILSGNLSGVDQNLNFENLPAGQYLIRFTENPEVLRFSKL